MLGIFLSFYATIRFFAHDTNRGSLARFIRFIPATGLVCVLGLALSATVLLPAMHVVLSNPRVGATHLRLLPNPVERITLLARLFSNDLLGTGNDFRGAQGITTRHRSSTVACSACCCCLWQPRPCEGAREFFSPDSGLSSRRPCSSLRSPAS